MHHEWPHDALQIRSTYEVGHRKCNQVFFLKYEPFLGCFKRKKNNSSLQIRPGVQHTLPHALVFSFCTAIVLRVSHSDMLLKDTQCKDLS